MKFILRCTFQSLGPGISECLFNRNTLSWKQHGLSNGAATSPANEPRVLKEVKRRHKRQHLNWV